MIEFALAFAHSAHVDASVFLADSKFLATKEERGNLGAMDNVLAGKAGDVGTCAAHVFALDDHHALALLRGSPCDELAAGATAQNDNIIVFSFDGLDSC